VTPLALETDETLLILKVAFLVLLYGFIILVVRSATRDLGGAPQESIMLGAAEADALRRAHGLQPARFEVVAAPELAPGSAIDVLSSTVVGRDPGSGIRLDGDEYASARHARIDPRPEGVWVEDLGSTNGTFVNGEALTEGCLLRPGDVLRIGQTELQLQP
jgi:hypothetical protein